MGETGNSFLAFLASRREDLRRIARSSCGEYEIDDLSGEAWIIAGEIGHKRGFAVDFANSVDQGHILARLYNKLVRYAEKNIRFAVRLDKNWDSDDPGAAIDSLSRLLTAPEHFDPIIRLQANQEQSRLLAIVRHSYSQASAYVILLHRADWDFGKLAGSLGIVLPTLWSRLIACGVMMRFQPSLFDRIQAIDYLFQPTVARAPYRTVLRELGQRQFEWEFA